MSRLCLGTRGRTLALAQSAWVKRQIEEHVAQLQVELRVIKTGGDRFLSSHFGERAGFFFQRIDSGAAPQVS